MEAGEEGRRNLPLAQMGFHQSKKNHYIWSTMANVTRLKDEGNCRLVENENIKKSGYGQTTGTAFRTGCNLCRFATELPLQNWAK